MRVSFERGVIGHPEGVHWGQTGDTGEPVLAIVGQGMMVRIVMTPEEAKEHGAGACFMGVSCALTTQAATGNVGDGLRATSSLVGSNGLPLGGG